MNKGHAPLRLFPRCVLAVLCSAALLALPLHGGNPQGADYSADTDRLLWFVHFADIHVGARGSQDTDNLHWLVTTGKSVIQPEFMVAAGDLTDSTNGNWLGWPNGPYLEEWEAYAGILEGTVTAADYYDLPGNHDAYSDRDFAYYRAYSVQGRATGGTQLSWTREKSFGKYHFLGANTAANDGAPFSFFFPYGDNAGLDQEELSFIGGALSDHSDADLTLVFGHHPVTDTGDSGDTWLFYGHRDFVSSLDSARASLYGYGHTHQYSDVLFAGNDYTGLMAEGGVRYLNISSLGKASSFHYSVVAIDCNGVAAVAADVNQWPVVLVTAPLDKAPNPYAYAVPASAGNPVRALVFDARAVTSVRYRVDGAGDWYAMSRVADGRPLWTGTWDASGLVPGDHTLTVEAPGTSTRSHTISFTVMEGSPANRAPAALNDAFTIDQGTSLSIGAPGVLANDSDPDGDPLTARSDDPVLGTDGSLSYTPDPGFSGIHAFTYKAFDGSLYSDPATVTITVNPSVPPNPPPVASDDAYETEQGAVLVVPAPGVLANDTDDGPLTAALVSGPAHGTLALEADGSFTYTPDAAYAGADSFQYSASDGSLGSTAVVNILVRAASPETVTITLAEYRAKPKQLRVEAISSRQPQAVLTLVGYGTMTYDAASQKYVYAQKVKTAPGGQVTVQSSEGGSATREVTFK